MIKEYKVENVQRAMVNGRAVKLFKAFRLIGDAYVFQGYFSAPAKVPNRKLINRVG